MRLISLGHTRSQRLHSTHSWSPRSAAADQAWALASLNSWSGARSRGQTSTHWLQLIQPRLADATFAGWGTVAAGTLTRLMQSTGQAGMQSSQPVQSCSTTVCIKPFAPTIASTGQGGRHNAQPMHFASSITASIVSGCATSTFSRGASGPMRSRSRITSSGPPGGQRSIAVPAATASA